MLGYFVITGAVYLLISGVFYSHGTSLISKSINLLILTILSLFPIISIDFNIKRIKGAVSVAFLVTLIGVLLVDVMRVNQIESIVHFTQNSNMRPRGFSLESSYLGSTIVVLGLLLAHFLKNRALKVTTVAGLFIILFYVGSKGGLLLFSLTLFAVFLFYKRHLLLKFMMFPIIILGMIFVLVKINNELAIDISKYTSVATRGTLILSSILILLHYPLGVGFSGYLPMLSSYIPNAIYHIQSWTHLHFDFSEVISYIDSSNSKNISTKSFLFDNIIFFGFPFLILYLIFNGKLIIDLYRQKKTLLFACIIFTFLSISTYLPLLGLYHFSLAYGVAYFELYRHKDTGRGARLSLSSESRGETGHLGKD
jgi:hypothetical protein